MVKDCYLNRSDFSLVYQCMEIVLTNNFLRFEDVDATCSDFDFGTALHIAASNLCIGAVKCLLGHGANPAFKNEKGQIPADVISNPVDMPLEMADAAAIAKELKQMLLDAVTLSCDISRAMPLNFDHVSGQAFLKSLGIKLGDRVSIAGQKIGSLRFCGPTQFAGGQWAGIELDDPEGKNDGSVGGVQYFKCPLKHGIFAPLSKISKAADHKKSTLKTLHQLKSTYKLQKTDLSRVTSKLDTGSVTSKPLTCTESKVISPSKEVAKSQGGGRGLWSRAISMGSVNSDETDIKLGDRVLVVGQRTGVVRFCGKTSFAPGCWYGIELDKPHGKNDGSVGGVRYFTCAAKHGVFAPPSRVQRITDSMDSLSDIPASKLNHSFPGFRRSLSSSSTVSSQNDQNRLKSFSSKKPIFRRSWSSTSGGSSEGTVKLRKGSQVLLVSSNEMATVRYIGPTDFASGIWLGLELKSPKGKNDGSVGEKRYFTCKQNYGVLVRPTRVTYRGINGGKLVDDIS
ncbi:CAP-Gly domain-containing linker protein 4 [Protopterus annectens]|uniref:CAP-Gly domain-containing linker protein 4 n=1 Tax=Protopterus annectens TaxID=7888 RepID=UPI001CFA2FDE|nr:CAP-Gly domain-containing linker protein 4 [Protopterus annectens]